MIQLDPDTNPLTQGSTIKVKLPAGADPKEVTMEFDGQTVTITLEDTEEGLEAEFEVPVAAGPVTFSHPDYPDLVRTTTP